MYEIIEPKSWNELRSFLDQMHHDWIFRGESEFENELKTSMDRVEFIDNVNPPKFKQNLERLILDSLNRNIHQFEKESRVLINHLQGISFLQHYGAPTRLLDFTSSPYAALFFALEHFCKTDSVLYAFNSLNFNTDPFSLFINNEIIFNKIKTPRGINDPQIFSEIVLGEIQYKFVATIQPYFLFNRITSQSGCFLVQGDINSNFEDNLKENLKVNKTNRSLLYKIRIPSNMRLEILSHLKRMNITRATLFPDVEGFVKSLTLTTFLNMYNKKKTLGS